MECCYFYLVGLYTWHNPNQYSWHVGVCWRWYSVSYQVIRESVFTALREKFAWSSSVEAETAHVFITGQLYQSNPNQKFLLVFLWNDIVSIFSANEK